jgi:hypothetical protein
VRAGLATTDQVCIKAVTQTLTYVRSHQSHQSNRQQRKVTATGFFDGSLGIRRVHRVAAHICLGAPQHDGVEVAHAARRAWQRTQVAAQLVPLRGGCGRL